jgi:tetratricopeptide (TPR) repeat protein
VPSASPLTAIIALARAGATEEAWRRMEQLGLAQSSEPAALVVRGRLLKDKATAASGDDRRRLYREAGEAYAKAAELEPGTYPLVNAATLSLLGGDVERGRALAEAVLASIDANPDEPETPYYRIATGAEALLLLGREEKAREALGEAVALAPRAWEDHASTLRQFGLILEAQRRDSSWLDAHRPPASLHFGGHMSFRAEGERPELVAEVRRVLEAERIGFGFGALAAGADIIVAEALLDHGAELHLVLPGGAGAFAARSVDPFGPEWRRRFDSALARAASVRPLRPLGAEPDATTIGLADEVAMGAAAMNARRIESKAVQLLVLADGASERSREAWAETGRAQHVIAATRDAPGGEGAGGAARPWRPLALLVVALDGAVGEAGGRLAALRDALAMVPAPCLGPYLGESGVLLGYASPVEAARAALRLRSPGVRIGGHYGAAEVVRDPFAGAERVVGDAAAAAAGALASALPGTAYVSEDFAAALAAGPPGAPRAEPIGELEPPDDGPPVGLYLLKS